MVPEEGIEPTQCYHQRILSPFSNPFQRRELTRETGDMAALLAHIRHSSKRPALR